MAYSIALLKTNGSFIGLRQFVRAIAPACLSSAIGLKLLPSSPFVKDARTLTLQRFVSLKISSTNLICAGVSITG